MAVPQLRVPEARHHTVVVVAVFSGLSVGIGTSAAARLGVNAMADVAGTDLDDGIMPNVKPRSKHKVFSITDTPRRVSSVDVEGSGREQLVDDADGSGGGDESQRRDLEAEHRDERSDRDGKGHPVDGVQCRLV